jgi:hypothetical protein
MIARCRGGGRPAPDYEIARLTVALRDLRVRDDAWARMDPAHADAHLRLWIDVTRRAQPGHLAAPAELLAFGEQSSASGHGACRDTSRPGETAAQDIDMLSRYDPVKRLALVACLVHTTRMRPAMTWPRCHASGWQRM